MKILLLNGPPDSGKDTIANMLCDRHPGMIHEKFARPLRDAVKFFTECGEQRIDKSKDEVFYRLGGKTIRQFMIAYSNFLKEIFGEDYLGRQLVERIKVRRLEGVGIPDIVVSDSGFIEEMYPLFEFAGDANVHLFQIYRDGCDFFNDSRGYVEVQHHAAQSMVDNNRTIDKAVEFIESEAGLPEFHSDK